MKVRNSNDTPISMSWNSCVFYILDDTYVVQALSLLISWEARYRSGNDNSSIQKDYFM